MHQWVHYFRTRPTWNAIDFSCYNPSIRNSRFACQYDIKSVCFPFLNMQSSFLVNLVVIVKTEKRWAAVWGTVFALRMWFASVGVWGQLVSVETHLPYAELLMQPWRLSGAGATLPHIWSQLPRRGCVRVPTHPHTTRCSFVQSSSDHFDRRIPSHCALIPVAVSSSFPCTSSTVTRFPLLLHQLA